MRRLAGWGRRSLNHVVKVRAGGDHRVNGVFLLDAKVDDHGAFGRFGLSYRGLDLVATFDSDARQAVRFGELHEVGLSIGVAT